MIFVDNIFSWWMCVFFQLCWSVPFCIHWICFSFTILFSIWLCPFCICSIVERALKSFLSLYLSLDFYIFPILDQITCYNTLEFSFCLEETDTSSMQDTCIDFGSWTLVCLRLRKYPWISYHKHSLNRIHEIL